MHKIFDSAYANADTRANADALWLSSEYLHVIVVEAIHRAALVAKEAGDASVEPHHLEMVLPQVLLDF